MNEDKTPRCLEGWAPEQLMAFVDGELDEPTARRLEDHLGRCSICSGELDRLQTVNNLLTAHPEVFHPDAQELYSFAAQSHDPNGMIARHLDSCRQCREEVDLLRQMIVMAAEPDRVRSPIPPSLRAKLESTYPSAPGARLRKQLALERLMRLSKSYFRPPVLALGTAAALVIVSVLLIQVWREQVDIPRAASQPSEALSLTESETSYRDSPGLEANERRRPPEPVQQRLAEEQERSVSKPAAPSKPRPRVMADSRVQSPTERTEEVSSPAKRPSGSVASGRKEKERRAQQTAPQSGLDFRLGTETKAGHSDLEKPSILQAAPAQPAVQAVVPLKIRIVGPDKLDALPPELTGAPSAGRLVLGDRHYKLLAVEQERIPPDTSQVKRDRRASFAAEAQDVPPGGVLVLVNVRQSGEEFDVDVELFEKGAKLKKTIREDHVGKGNLKDRIGHMVSSVLESR